MDRGFIHVCFEIVNLMFTVLFPFPSCAQLLRRSPERRLGAGERDAEEVKKHLFFRVRNGKIIFTDSGFFHRWRSLTSYSSSQSETGDLEPGWQFNLWLCS